MDESLKKLRRVCAICGHRRMTKMMSVGEQDYRICAEDEPMATLFDEALTKKAEKAEKNGNAESVLDRPMQPLSYER